MCRDHSAAAGGDKGCRGHLGRAERGSGPRQGSATGRPACAGPSPGRQGRPARVSGRLLPLRRGPRQGVLRGAQAGSRAGPMFTHYGRDAHQDHRLVAEVTHSTFRRHLVLEYEVMKTDGDLGNPQVYVPLDTRTVQKKVAILMDCFGSQRSRTWFSEDAFRGLMPTESGASRAWPRRATRRRSTHGESRDRPAGSGRVSGRHETSARRGWSGGKSARPATATSDRCTRGRVPSNGRS